MIFLVRMPLTILWSHTKSCLYAGGCLVSPYGDPPTGGFCTSESEDDPGSGGGSPGAGGGGRASRGGSGLSRFATSPCGVMDTLPAMSAASTCQGPSTFCAHHPASPGGRPCWLAWQVSHCLTLRRTSCSI